MTCQCPECLYNRTKLAWANAWELTLDTQISVIGPVKASPGEDATVEFLRGITHWNDLSDRLTALFHSLQEAITNTAEGYLVSLASQVVIFLLLVIHVPLRTNMIIGTWFTAISIARGYFLRRIFTRRAEA